MSLSEMTLGGAVRTAVPLIAGQAAVKVLPAALTPTQSPLRVQ
jgi:hypothetical protein